MIMRKFTLLIDGEDLDTGIYEYFPYADNYISDFKTTFRIITQLKLGKLSEDSEEANKYIFAKYCVNKEDTNKKAIEAAYKAFLEFRYFPLAKRKKILYDIHKYLVQKKEELIKLMIIEGHPRKVCEWEFSCMERGYRKETLDFFKSELWRKIAQDGNESIYLARRPDGIVCVVPPRNAPCSNSLTGAYALLSGNTIIIKPPMQTPLSTIFLWKEIVWKAAKENNVPNGTINIIVGNSKKIMEEWLSDPIFKDIIFFGDSKNGLEIGQKIFEAGKKPILELSGNDMMLVWKDADLENSTEALLDAFIGSTQICMVPKKALIHREISRVFINEFIDKVKNLKIGLPSDSQTIFTPVVRINEYYEFLNEALERGAKILYGGERVNHKGLPDKNGVYFVPTVLLIEDYKEAINMKCIKEENFFPLLPLIIFDGSDKEIFEKMIEVVHTNEYGLRISLWINPSNKYLKKFVKCLDNSGLLRINSRHIDFSVCLSTHGGIGKTGGPFGEMNYMWQKTTHLQGISIKK
jgi:acyl-CoA reductase-like NAD-dependent aldehyde dehydrogenase